MAWVRFEDNYPENEKLEQVGPLGLALDVRAICYCNRNLTDGRIPVRVALRLSGDFLDYDVNPRDVIQQLVDVGRWIDQGDHYQIHNYLEYQPSRESVEAKREQAKERKRRWRDRRSSQRDGTRDKVRDERNTRTRSQPDPDQGSLVAPTETTPEVDPIQEQAKEVIRRANEITGKQWRKPHKFLTGRLNEGYKADDLIAAVEFCHAQWSGDEKMQQFVRQLTIFGPEKCEGYVDGARAWIQGGRPPIGPDGRRSRNSAPDAASREVHQQAYGEGSNRRTEQRRQIQARQRAVETFDGMATETRERMLDALAQQFNDHLTQMTPDGRERFLRERAIKGILESQEQHGEMT